MAEVSPAKVRIEIFRQPLILDDHFYKNWNISGAVTKNDDEIKFASESAYAYKTLSFSTSTYKYLAFRISYITAWSVKVEGRLSGVVKFTIEKDAAGFYDTDISALYSGSIDEIRILQNGVGTVRIDYLVISKESTILPSDADYEVLSITLEKELVNKAISGGEIILRNIDGYYSSKLKSFDGFILWIARSDSNLGKISSKIFGGRIMKTSVQGEGYGKMRMTLEVESYSQELFRPPVLFQKHYENINGRTIIEDVLNTLSYLTYSQIATLWFDNTGSSGVTDDEISSTHHSEWDRELPSDVIFEILKRASNPAGAKGFDLYEYPSGILRGHLKNSEDFKIPETLSPEIYSKSEDLHPVFNTLIVYGSRERSLPSDKDSWTEDLSNWSAALGYLVKSGLHVGGNYSVCDVRSGELEPDNKFSRTLPSVQADYPKEQYKQLRFYYRWFVSNADAKAKKPLYFRIWLENDSSNMFYYTLDREELVSAETWRELTLDLGREEEGVSSEGKWEKVGNPTWDNINKITFLCAAASIGTFTYDQYFYIDNLHFYGARFKGTAGDDPSISLYSKRFSKSIIDDSLLSMDECIKKAESEIAFSKDPIITLEDIRIDGVSNYNPGDLIFIEIPQENISDWFRILTIRHSIKGSVWDIFLTLSNEPIYFDYILKSLGDKNKYLERRR